MAWVGRPSTLTVCLPQIISMLERATVSSGLSRPLCITAIFPNPLQSKLADTSAEVGFGVVSRVGASSDSWANKDCVRQTNTVTNNAIAFAPDVNLVQAVGKVGDN